MNLESAHNAAKKVRISQSLYVDADEHRAHFNTKNIDETLHPFHKDYGMVIIPGTKTPFPQKLQPLDPNILRQRLYLYKQSSEADSTESDASVITTQSVQSGSLLRERQSIVDKKRLRYETKREHLYKSQYTVVKQTQDMRKIMHPRMESVPGVSIHFPPVAWPNRMHDQRYTIYN